MQIKSSVFKKSRLWTGIMAVLLMNMAGQVAAKEISGDQFGTWTVGESPYIVVGDITVPAGKILAIEPEVVIKFNQDKRLVIYGGLKAIGNSAQPIIFTSNQATPTAGYWRCLYFVAGSRGYLKYCEIKYGGKSEDCNIYCRTNGLIVTYATITHSSKHGIRCNNSAPTISHNYFSDNFGSAIKSENNANPIICDNTITKCTDGLYQDTNSFPVYRDNILFNNTYNAVGVSGGNISKTGTWTNNNGVLNYVITGNITIVSKARLRIEPGVVIKFTQKKGWLINGGLSAIGSPTQPIVFTSNQATPTAGYWRCLYFVAGSRGYLKYCEIKYGGKSEGCNIYSQTDGLVVEYATITNSSQHGIRCNNSAPTISHNYFSDNFGSAIKSENNANPIISNNTFIDNSDPAFPIAKIISPTEFSILSSPFSIPIIGSAYHTDFESYKLEYGTSNFMLIATSTTQVVNGTLTIWNTTVLATDTYTLRLSAYDTRNNRSINEVKLIIECGGDVIPPLAKITLPEDNSVISGIVPIWGTATDENFLNYIVQYGVGSLPLEWVSLATSTTPVINGTLTLWETMSLTDGTYTLKLVVNDKSSNMATDTVKVSLDNTPPVAQIISPANNSILKEGTITIIGTTDDEHLLEWTLECNTILIASSTTKVILGTLTTTYLPAGLYTLLLTVKDVTHKITTHTVSFIVQDILPTPDQLLQKVADNFAKIEDMKASVTTTGSIGTETFSEIMGSFLMKKPDKVKIITPVKDETIIFNGDKMYIIEKGEVEELGFDEISDMPLSLLDFYYHLEDFKEGHNIAIIDCQGDSYTLEVTLKETFISKYDRIKIVIDYSKGLDIKKEVFFDQTSEPQLITEIKDDQLIGDVYIPTQIVERIVFEDATVTSMTTYSNIEINKGIPDSEFEP